MRINAIQATRNQQTNSRLKTNNQSFGCVYLKLGDIITAPKIAVTNDKIGNVVVSSINHNEWLGEFFSESSIKASKLIDELGETIEDAGDAKIFKPTEPPITHPKFPVLKELLTQIVTEAKNAVGLKSKEVTDFQKIINEATEGNAINLPDRNGGFVLGSPFGKF